MCLMTLLFLLAAEPADADDGDALYPMAVMQRAVEHQPYAGNYEIAVRIEHTDTDGYTAHLLSFEFAWNTIGDFEFRPPKQPDCPPLVSCRGDLCVLDGQHLFERRWLEAYNVDFDAFSPDPSLQDTLHTARDMLQSVVDTLLFPLTGFCSNLREWPYFRNEFVQDGVPEGVYRVQSNPWSPAESRILGDQGSGLRFVQEVDARTFRLLRNRTVEDGVTLRDHTWKWAGLEPDEEEDRLGLIEADFLVYFDGYPERFTYTVLSDRRIQPGDVFVDPAVFDISGEVIAWPERARPVHRASVIHYIFPVLPYAAVATLAALIAFLVYRIRKRKAPQPYQT